MNKLNGYKTYTWLAIIILPQIFKVLEIEVWEAETQLLVEQWGLFLWSLLAIYWRYKAKT